MSGAADRTIAGIVLAGGAGTRVGGADKGLLAFRGKPLVEHALGFLAASGIAEVVISANRNVDRYARYGVRVVRDESDGYEGPLAGIVAAMAVIDADFVLTIPVDVPGLPSRLPSALLAEVQGAAIAEHRRIDGLDVAVAHDGESRQPLCAIYRRDVLEPARLALHEGRRSVRAFQDTLRCREVRVGTPADYRNLNAPEQYA